MNISELSAGEIRVLAGLCMSCSRKLPENYGKKTCPKCLQRHKVYYRKRIANRICTLCGLPLPEIGKDGEKYYYIKCEKCRDIENIKRRKDGQKHTKERETGEKKGEQGNGGKIYGRCTRCGRFLPKKHANSLCDTCIECARSVYRGGDSGR